MSTMRQNSMKEIYKTTILQEKQEDFLNFLLKLGISEDGISFEGRGNYYLCTIDLSSFDLPSLNKIREELNTTQIDFL